MQKTDEWSTELDFTINSEPENNESDESDEQEEDYFHSEKTVYVITQDNIPLLYVNTIEDAHSMMWTLTRNYRIHWCNNYNTYIREGSSQNKIEITGNYRYLLIFYERLLSTFEIHPVHEMVKNTKKNQ